MFFGGMDCGMSRQAVCLDERIDICSLHMLQRLAKKQDETL